MKYIVVPATGGATDLPVFEAALNLAELFDGHVVFLHVREDAVQMMTTMVAADVDGPIGTSDLTGELEREGAAQEARAKLAVETLCNERDLPLATPSTTGVSTEWASAIGNSPETLIAYARAADVVVMGRDERVGDSLSQVLMEAGRPVLFVPNGAPPGLLDRIVIAWNDTVEAARAVTAATPLLDRAKSVAVLTVGDGPDPSADESANRLAAGLRHHATTVTLAALRTEGRPAGEVLLEWAQADGATLLVMGGYSHSRLRQMVFGGFTREILEHATLPVLIAH